MSEDNNKEELRPTKMRV